MRWGAYQSLLALSIRRIGQIRRCAEEMIPLNQNLRSRSIVIPILSSLAYVCMSTIADGGVGGEGNKDQEQY